MKPLARTPLALALSALALLASASAADKQGTTYDFTPNGAKLRRVPLEERRVPAFRRIETQLTPLFYEGRPLVRTDEVASHVLSVHVFASGGKPQLRAGHALAPDVARSARP
jgi:hypothetical protein